MKKTVSIGVICFNEELNVNPAYKEFVRVTNKNKKYTFEFIFVDNGSTDNTRNEIRKIAKIDRRVIGVFLSRNFGPEASTQAALDHASGDAFIVYEGDMQDPPSLIPEFINKWEDGYDLVVGIRNKTDDDFLMTLTRRFYYKIFRFLSNVDVPVNAGSFSLIDKKAMDAIIKLPEKYRFFRGLRSWVGFKTAYITYERQRRQRGKSSYNFLGYIKHAERSFFGFSYLPLDLMVYFGFILVFFSFIFITIYLVMFAFLGNPIKASVAIFVAIVFFGGIQLLALSVIGKYIQVIVEETKARPTYIVDEIVRK